MTDRHRTEWSDRTHPLFAEVAEALGTTTNLVMAAMEQDGHVYAMATPDYPASRDVLRLAFIRNHVTGVLDEIRREVEPRGLDDLEARINRELGEK